MALEQLLAENESRFYKNLNDYRQIINSLKEKYFDFQQLETKLSESEARRLQEQEAFREQLFLISIVVLVFGVLIKRSKATSPSNRCPANIPNSPFSFL